MQPVVSVIIPFLYNEDISGRCLKSVQGQTFREIQIICVCGEDFADSNGQYLRKLAKEDPRILVVERKTEEVHNAGLSRAVGEYSLLLNPEDYCEPDMLEHVVRVMQKDRADFVVFRAEVCTDGNFKTTTIREKDLPPYTPFSSRSITGDINAVFSSLLQDKLYSREFLLLKNLEFDRRRADGVQDFVQRALTAARRITYMEDVLVHIGRDCTENRSKCRWSFRSTTRRNISDSAWTAFLRIGISVWKSSVWTTAQRTVHPRFFETMRKGMKM